MRLENYKNVLMRAFFLRSVALSNAHARIMATLWSCATVRLCDLPPTNYSQSSNSETKITRYKREQSSPTDTVGLFIYRATTGANN